MYYFFTVQRKEIVCFYCDGSLRKEVLATNPWKEHGRWFPVCPHVMKTKGESYVHDVMIVSYYFLKTMFISKKDKKCILLFK